MRTLCLCVARIHLGLANSLPDVAQPVLVRIVRRFGNRLHCRLTGLLGVQRLVEPDPVDLGVRELGFGLGLTGLGLLLGAFLVYTRLTEGPVSAVSVIFDAFCVIIGVQSILFALWMDMERNKDLK